MNTLEEICSQARVRVLPWQDPVVDAVGHDPRSYYVERFWLPVLGPSTVLFLRQVALALDAAPAGCELELGETARRLGLGERPGRHSPLARTLARCIDFEMARPAGMAALAVRRRLPPLARRQLSRLTESLLAEHGRWAAAAVAARPGWAGASFPRTPAEPLLPFACEDLAGAGGDGAAGAPPAGAPPAGSPPAGAPPVDLLRQRGRQLALSLLQLGEEPVAAERQLVRWRYHPALAGECTAWAASVHEQRLAAAAGTGRGRGASA